MGLTQFPPILLWRRQRFICPSASWFAGLAQGSLPLSKYNQKFCSLQSRLQASDAESCSFYKIGLKKLLQEFLVHHNLPNELEPLIREVAKWNQRYLSSKTHPSSNMSPAACLFVPDKVPLSSTPPPGTKSKAGGPSSTSLSSLQVFPLANKTSTLTLLSLSDTSKSPTVLVTIYGPLGKIKVLALLNTGADANFIEEKLANLIGLLASGYLDIRVENSTLTSATPIPQPVTIDLESSLFCNTCNFSLTYLSCSSLDSHGLESL
ncbi:hypothetical protein DSO57_1009230 [Entomophthora muscae]|uniref:Uncharacterized protein n=1 Tax=Entomophthora muscae TaxID=34485 RepID=A0ACC2TI56_9FUNG|nr:hypothetical protein DSO57_1009230 [Entomophthora muscae]